MTKAVITKLSDEQILLKRYYPSGQLKFEGHYKMPNEFYHKFHDGVEITLENYETNNGTKNGRASWWHNNGQKARIEDYNGKNGKRDGKLTSWYRNGQKEREGTLKDGKRDGTWTAWHKNGQKAKEGNLENGKPDGKWMQWHYDSRIQYDNFK